MAQRLFTINRETFNRRRYLEFYYRNDQSLKSLIQLGTVGHFPIFESSWVEEAHKNHKKLTGNEKSKAKTLLKKLCDHRTIDRKKTVLFALEAEDRRVVVKAFMKLVETKILDSSPEIH